MRAWTCIDHDTIYPVGGASVVVATDEASAKSLLRGALKDRSLKPDGFTLKELRIDKPGATVLRDGDY